jgi:hypothetical protein|tara:strand:- start:113 stop:706 length:594 start_codon:yes stop_codon:yes gene_type:complete
MRKLVRKSIAILIMFITLNVSASVMEPVIKVLDKNDMSIRFMMDDLNEDFEIVIKDLSGVIYFRETIKAINYSKNFSFTGLLEGSYFIEVSSMSSAKKIPFAIEGNEVDFSKNEETRVFRPFLYKNDSMVTILKHNLNPKDLEVTIFDSESHLLYRGIIDIEKKNGVKLNLTNLDKGKYKIVLKTDDVKFVEYVILN